MIQKLTAPCYVLDPSPHEESDQHFTSLERAAAWLHEHLEEARRDNDPDQLADAERIAIVQNPAQCSALTCDDCGDEYEDDEIGVWHLATVEDDRAAVGFAVGFGWTRGPGGTINCTACPPLTDPDPGPTEYDVPLPIPDIVQGAL